MTIYIFYFKTVPVFILDNHVCNVANKNTKMFIQLNMIINNISQNMHPIEKHWDHFQQKSYIYRYKKDKDKT